MFLAGCTSLHHADTYTDECHDNKNIESCEKAGVFYLRHACEKGRVESCNKLKTLGYDAKEKDLNKFIEKK